MIDTEPSSASQPKAGREFSQTLGVVRVEDLASVGSSAG